MLSVSNHNEDRLSSILPAIKCSMCGSAMSPSAISDHVCNTNSQTQPEQTNNSNKLNLQPYKSNSKNYTETKYNQLKQNKFDFFEDESYQETTIRKNSNTSLTNNVSSNYYDSSLSTKNSNTINQNKYYNQEEKFDQVNDYSNQSRSIYSQQSNPSTSNFNYNNQQRNVSSSNLSINHNLNNSINSNNDLNIIYKSQSNTSKQQYSVKRRSSSFSKNPLSYTNTEFNPLDAPPKAPYAFSAKNRSKSATSLSSYVSNLSRQDQRSIYFDPETGSTAYWSESSGYNTPRSPTSSFHSAHDVIANDPTLSPTLKFAEMSGTTPYGMKKNMTNPFPVFPGAKFISAYERAGFDVYKPEKNDKSARSEKSIKSARSNSKYQIQSTQSQNQLLNDSPISQPSHNPDLLKAPSFSQEIQSQKNLDLNFSNKKENFRSNSATGSLNSSNESLNKVNNPKDQSNKAYSGSTSLKSTSSLDQSGISYNPPTQNRIPKNLSNSNDLYSTTSDSKYNESLATKSDASKQRPLYGRQYLEQNQKDLYGNTLGINGQKNIPNSNSKSFPQRNQSLVSSSSSHSNNSQQLSVSEPINQDYNSYSNNDSNTTKLQAAANYHGHSHSSNSVESAKSGDFAMAVTTDNSSPEYGYEYSNSKPTRNNNPIQDSYNYGYNNNPNDYYNSNYNSLKKNHNNVNISPPENFNDYNLNSHQNGYNDYSNEGHYQANKEFTPDYKRDRASSTGYPTPETSSWDNSEVYNQNGSQEMYYTNEVINNHNNNNNNNNNNNYNNYLQPNSMDNRNNGQNYKTRNHKEKDSFSSGQGYFPPTPGLTPPPSEKSGAKSSGSFSELELNSSLEKSPLEDLRTKKIGDVIAPISKSNNRTNKYNTPPRINTEMANNSVDLPMPHLLNNQGLNKQGVNKKGNNVQKGVKICRGCDKQIHGKAVISADGQLSGRWHRKCMCCIDCGNPFSDGIFYVYDDLPYCAVHFHARNGSICLTCGKGIEGRCLEVMPLNEEEANMQIETLKDGTTKTNKWLHHLECLCCAECNVKIADSGEYYEVDDIPLCAQHAYEYSEGISERMHRRCTRMII